MTDAELAEYGDMADGLEAGGCGEGCVTGALAIRGLLAEVDRLAREIALSGADAPRVLTHPWIVCPLCRVEQPGPRPNLHTADCPYRIAGDPEPPPAQPAVDPNPTSPLCAEDPQPPSNEQDKRSDSGQGREGEGVTYISESEVFTVPESPAAEIPEPGTVVRLRYAGGGRYVILPPTRQGPRAALRVPECSECRSMRAENARLRAEVAHLRHAAEPSAQTGNGWFSDPLTRWP